MIEPKHSKLFKLKKWLTITEAAKHLSAVCGEEVTEADIFRLAIDKHLKLSVNFVNSSHGRRGNVVQYDETEWDEIVEERSEDGTISLIMKSFPIGSDKYLNLTDEIIYISGVWDLPMIGGEFYCLEAEFHQLIEGPIVETYLFDGTFVQHENGDICQLLTPICGYSTLESLGITHYEKYLKLQRNPIKNWRKERILELRKAKTAELHEKFKKWNTLDKYEPAKRFPNDSVYVVRTDALRGVEQSLSDSDKSNNTTKSNGYKEYHAQNREQILGAAFAVLAKWPSQCLGAKGEPVASKIANLVEAKANLFWPNALPPLKVDQIADHLRDWIKKANSRE